MGDGQWLAVLLAMVVTDEVTALVLSGLGPVVLVVLGVVPRMWWWQ